MTSRKDIDDFFALKRFLVVGVSRNPKDFSRTLFRELRARGYDAVTERVVRDCDDAAVRVVWMYRAVGAGAVSRAAVDFCRARGMRVIEGECPFLFLPKAGWPHLLHRFCRKVLGTYPR